jgi:carboxypeptidase Q
MKRCLLIVALTPLALSLVASAQAPVPATRSTTEAIDYAGLGRIREEGLLRSQVMDHISWLSDVYGPRITGGPQIRQAAEWVMKKAREWRLANVHLEPFPFGKGWSAVRFSAEMIDPQFQPMIGHPRGWSPATAGTITADVVHASITNESDFARYRGKLQGKIVLPQPPRDVRMLEGRVVWRWSDQELAEAASLPIPPPNPVRTPPQARPTLEDKMHDFFRTEGVIAVLDRGSDQFIVDGGTDNSSVRVQRTDGGTIFVGRLGQPTDDHSRFVPTATIAVEHYNRMVRVLEKGLPVRVALNIQTAFHDEGPNDGFNVVAEIPGTDRADEVVIIGAHFDTQYAGTGATDNAAGSAGAMEVMRILQTLGVRPRRTIRMVLWGGEELGHLGSRHYARERFGDPETMALKPEHAKVAAYFNVDNGSGRIRGVWLQGNLAVAPVFQQWMEPLRDLGVTTLAPRSVGGTDHLAFDELGLPGFQFIQDRLEYNSRTHHSNMDVVDHVVREDVMQIATVWAAFAYNAAMRDEKLPREALPAPRKIPATASNGR